MAKRGPGRPPIYGREGFVTDVYERRRNGRLVFRIEHIGSDDSATVTLGMFHGRVSLDALATLGEKVRHG